MQPPGPYLLTFLTFADATGTLVTTQDGRSLPFAIERVFWVYQLPANAQRGGHAHRTTQELLTVMRGTVRVETLSAEGEQTFELTDPSQGLYIPPMCWIKVFPAEGALICCLASTGFDEADYIRDFQEFQGLLS